MKQITHFFLEGESPTCLFNNLNRAGLKHCKVQTKRFQIFYDQFTVSYYKYYKWSKSTQIVNNHYYIDTMHK